MAGFDTSARRVIAVITLMVLAAWALRGYVPGGERATEPEPPQDNPAALFAVLALLCAAVAIIGFAILVRLRERKPVRPRSGALPRSPGVTGRPSWRLALIVLAVVIAWLLLVVALTALVQPQRTDQSSSAQSAASDEVRNDRPAPRLAGDDHLDVINYLIPPMLVLTALVVVGTAVTSRRQRRDSALRTVVDVEVEGPASPAPATSLARAAEVGLAEIGDLSREPREAIIACYAAMERELTRVPGAAPQDWDTPTEVLARAVRSGALRADSATELVELFEEARFSPHVMTESHRDAAVEVLQRVLAELPQREAAV